MVSLMKNFRERRAAKAVVRLFSESSRGHGEAECAQWQREDNDFREDYRDMVEAMAELEDLADDPDIMAIVQESPPSPVRAGSTTYWPKLAVAAGLVLAVTAGLVTYGSFGEKAGQEIDVARYLTKIGERKSVSLDDGSTITLNTGTSMLVELGEGQRRVILERGEAYFDVVRDPQRPFTIDLGSRAITVLGTEFNVRRSPEHFTVAVMEGAVSLHRKEEVVSASSMPLPLNKGATYLSDPGQLRLVAGDMVEFDAGTNRLAAYHGKDLSRVQAWRTGWLYFDEEPLSKVVHELNRYSGKKIMIEDASVMGLKVYAAVDLEHPDGVLSDLEKTFPIRVIRHFDRTIIVGKK